MNPREPQERRREQPSERAQAAAPTSRAAEHRVAVPLGGEVKAADENGEQIVEIMGETAGQQSEAFETLQANAFCLGLLARGDVAKQRQQSAVAGQAGAIQADVEPAIALGIVKFEVVPTPAEHGALEIAVILRLRLCRETGPELPTDQRCRAAEVNQRLGIGVGDDAVRIERQKRISNFIER